MCMFNKKQAKILGKVYKMICPVLIKFKVTETREDLHAVCIKRNNKRLVRHLVGCSTHPHEELMLG